MSKRIRLGMVGMGNRGASMAQHYFGPKSPNFELLAVQDQNRRRAEWAAEQSGTGCKVHDTIDELVADPDVEAVIVTTTDYAHAEPVVKALGAHKHVYCEKPMSTTIEDCDKIIEAAQKSDKVFYMGFNLRWHPMYEKAKQIIDSGALGNIHTGQFTETYYGGRTYHRRWNRLRKYGGGLWLTKATHDFDVMHYLLGKKPLRVSALANVAHYKPDPKKGQRCSDCPVAHECPDYWDYKADDEKRTYFETGEEILGFPPDICLYNSDKDTFDHGTTMLEYEDGVLAVYDLSVVAARSTRSFLIQGHKASLEGDVASSSLRLTERHTLYEANWDVSSRTAGGHGGADPAIMVDFAQAIRAGTKPRASWADGRLSVQTGLAARDSSDNAGAWVEIR